MSLKSGQRLGPYRIESPLGAGGMGEVYRAQDTRLGRSVAVKILPAQLAEHPQRRERFEREARAVAALSHPHICALFDVGEEDGVAFLVMEHLEGESLAERLSKGALPLDQVLEIGSQVASALDRAHRAGIAHRDLKPGNVMLTRSGAKLLDFGLAKSGLKEDEPAESKAPTEATPWAPQRDSNAPTEARPLTEAGAVMGTFQYMAPEQLEGEEADGRADIWALGCLLYEMTTGRSPFSGKSQASLISSIMRDAPVPVGERQPLTPPPLEHLINRCLEKDREDRWQSAHDVAEELAWIRLSAGRRSTPTAQTADARRRPRTGWVVLAVAVGSAAVAGAVLGRWLGAGFDTRGDHGVRVARQLTFHTGVESHPALSPNGQLLAYVSETDGDADIFVQRVDGRNSINLTGDSPYADTSPSFSPDGSQIAFRSERGGGGIFVMGATGESVRRLSDRGHDPSWSPDGKRIVVSTEQVIDPLARYATAELWTIDVGTGQMSRLYAGDAVQPAWSPDGARIAFWRVDGNSGQRDLATIDAEGREEPVAITTDMPVDWNPVWSADGRELYFVSDRAGTMDVWRVSLEPGTGRVEKGPERVGAPAQDVAWLAAAREDTSLAYVSRSALHYLYALKLEPKSLHTTGETQTLQAGALPIGYAHPSPDGASVALTTAGTREDVYVLDVEGRELRQLTDDPYRDRGPQWSPDGSEIAFYSNRSGTYQLWSIRPDGSGLRQLTDVPDGAWFPYWSPDGSRIAFPTSKATCVITVQDTAASSAECLPNPSEDVWFEVRDWSPDGLWLIGNPSLHGGAVLPDLLLWSFEESEYWSIEQAHGLVARWLPDSRGVLMFDGEGRLVRVDRETGATQDVGPIEGAGTVDREQLGLSRDGRTVLVQADSVESNIWLLAPAGPGSS
jgi:Tol biopolymer transport system component